MKKQLLVDIGHSRIKLASTDGHQFEVLDECLSESATRLPSLDQHEAVWVANVRQNFALDDWPVLAAVTQPVMNVTWQQCARHLQTLYVAEQLGIDRWLGLIAANARRASGQPAIVVDAGTAMTVDIVDAQGVHIGGYIVPGAALTIDCFEKKTQLLAASATDFTVLPTDTGSAIRNGAEMALLNFVRQMRQQYPDAALFLGGGAAEKWSNCLEGPVSLIPQLVLSGLFELVFAER